jgi:hypothetical protein
VNYFSIKTIHTMISPLAKLYAYFRVAYLPYAISSLHQIPPPSHGAIRQNHTLETRILRHSQRLKISTFPALGCLLVWHVGRRGKRRPEAAE